jgi:hypothetical protein
MSEEVLRDVTDATTSKEAWDTLKKMFSSTTRARTVQIRVDLATTKKRDLPAATYFSKIKGLASKLAAIDAPLHDDEVVAYLLAGLGSNYDPFVTSMTTKNEALSLDEVYAHLLSFEARQLQHQAEARLNIGASANVAGRGGSPGRGHASGRGRGRGRGVHGRDVSGSSRRSPCQICGKEVHTAIRCWYRMDDSYTDDPPSANMVATSSYQVDPNWYSDTGATDHITSDLDRLTMRQQYNGGDTVQVGNGAGLRIMHLGSCSIKTDTRPLTLNNVLHVPEIAKHLLSVHKLSCDNDVFFEFHPWYFFIKDRATRNLLLEGKCESGLYPIKP